MSNSPSPTLQPLFDFLGRGPMHAAGRLLTAFVLCLGFMGCNPDGDEDGLPDRDDCAPQNAKIAYTLAQDEDCDGTLSTDDCSPKDAADDKARSKDGDCDGLADSTDCDPKGHVGDDDCDETPNADDCAETDAAIKTTKALDTDCDGMVDTEDCSVSDPAIAFSTVGDQDCDGALDADDCAPKSAIVNFKKSVVGDCRGPLLGAETAPNVPSSFDDSNPMSGLITPVANVDDTSMSAGDRKALAAKATGTVWVAKPNCQVELNESLGKVMVDCGSSFGNGYYFGAVPVTKRTVSCETGEATSCGSCSTSEDCQIGIWTGCLLGCDRSRCVWGACTACPAERVCDDPEYEESEVASWAFSVSLKGEDLTAFKAAMGESPDYAAFKDADGNTDFDKYHEAVNKYSEAEKLKYVMIAFRPTSASRQVFSGKDEDGEYEELSNSGYRIKVSTAFLAYTDGTRWMALHGKSDLSGTLTVGGTAHSVKCSATACTVAN